jgi:hypothetical protein
MPWKPTVLSADQRRLVLKASPAAVVDSAAGLRRYLVNDRWLGTRNRYLRRPVKVVADDTKEPSQQDPKHLREYVAASSVLHAAEGWGYLGRALAAQAAGHDGIARHLGYYAELRAAMATLATQGIGVFSTNHAVVKADGKTQLFRGPGTHDMAWLALEAWADSSNGAAAIGAVITPEGASVAEWVSSFGAGATWEPLGRAWLRAWGLDLRRFTKDRLARNEASYRPALRGLVESDPANAVTFLADFWSLFEPGPYDSFSTLDRHLLRRSLESAFAAVTGKPRSVDEAGYKSRLEKALEACSEAGIDSTIGQFLMRSTEPDEAALLLRSEQRSTPLEPDYHLQVLSRAALLLRLSTGLVGVLLDAAEIDFDEVAFWYEPFVVEHGLCPKPAARDDPTAMWADIEGALADLDAAFGGGGPDSYWEFHQRCGPSLGILGGCERIAAWALA